MILKTLIGLAVILGGLGVCYGVGWLSVRYGNSGLLGDNPPNCGDDIALRGFVISVCAGAILLLACAVGSAILGGR